MNIRKSRFVFWFLLFIFHLTSLLSIFAEADSQAIAIIDFKSSGIEQSFINELVEKFSSEIEKIDEYKFIDREKRDAIMITNSSILSSGGDNSGLKELGELLAANYIISGSIGNEQGRIIFNSRNVKVETGETVSSFSKRYNKSDDILSDAVNIIRHLLKISESNSPIVAVLDFKSSNISTEQTDIFTEFIISSLHDLDEYTIINKEQRDSLLEEMVFSLHGLSDNEASLEMGRFLSASYLIDGSIGSIGNKRFFLNIKLIDVESAEVVVSVSEKYISIEDLLIDSYRIVHSFAGIDSRWEGEDITSTLTYQVMMHENWYSDIWCYGINFNPSYRHDWLIDSAIGNINIGGGVSLLLGEKILFFSDFAFQVPVFLYEQASTSVPILLPSGLASYQSSTISNITFGIAHRIQFSEASAILYGGGLHIGIFSVLENGNFDDFTDNNLVVLSLGPTVKVSYLMNFDDRFYLQLGLRANYDFGIYSDENQDPDFGNQGNQNLSISPEISFYMNQRRM